MVELRSVAMEVRLLLASSSVSSAILGRPNAHVRFQISFLQFDGLSFFISAP